jgi:hypothetical protein
VLDAALDGGSRKAPRLRAARARQAAQRALE